MVFPRRLPAAMAAIAVAAAVMTACGSSDPKPAGTTKQALPGIDPAAFAARVDNPYFPLRPGTTFRYRGSKDGKPSVDVFAVSRDLKRVAGVPCVVVRDNLFLSGKLAEQTEDWYTQDKVGNVWYFGEATRELDAKGRTTTTEGSWQAGVNGARPGIYMPAHPRVGESHRQEYLKGQAEDHFEVLDLHASVSVPYGSYAGTALRTKEWTPLEPAVVDNKYYVRGVGQVKEVSLKGPREVGSLVSVTRR
jgi:hypothetical protein